VFYLNLVFEKNNLILS